MKNSKKSSYQTVILNLIQDLQRLPLQFINSLRGRYPAGRPFKYGMTALLTRARAFTLMELLVVVLIIGVLAAVAVPQYKKAVLKSRFSTLMPIAKSLIEAQENYFLGNGEYSTRLEKLDVSVAGNASGEEATLADGTKISLSNVESHPYVRAEKEGVSALLTMYPQHSPNFAGEMHCEALPDDTLANWLCKDSLRGSYVGKKYGYNVYVLNAEQANGTLARTFYDLPASNKTVDGDTCIGTQTYGCQSKTLKNGAKCIGETVASCIRLVTDHSSCVAAGAGACGNASTFDKYSTCEGLKDGSCWGSTYQDHSTCTGGVLGAANIYVCYNGSYTGYSVCTGNVSYACRGNAYTDHSVCQAYVKGACKDAPDVGHRPTSYDSTSYCEGTYCPVDSPKQGGGTWRLCNEQDGDPADKIAAGQSC